MSHRIRTEYVGVAMLRIAAIALVLWGVIGLLGYVIVGVMV